MVQPARTSEQHQAVTEQAQPASEQQPARSTEAQPSAPAVSSPLVRSQAPATDDALGDNQQILARISSRAQATDEASAPPADQDTPTPDAEATETPAEGGEDGQPARGEDEAEPIPTISRDPESNPQFRDSMKRLKRGVKKVKTTEPAGKKVEAAKQAAKAPANAKQAGAKAAQVGKMKAADTDKKVDKDSFLTLLRAEIEKVMPKKVGEVEDYMKGDDKRRLKSGLNSGIASEKQKTTASLDSAANEKPDESKVEDKEVTPLAQEESPQAPQSIGASEAIPPERNEAEVKPDKESAQAELDKNDLDEQQLQKANDSRFSAVVDAKTQADEYADTVPETYRAEEKVLLQTTAVEGTKQSKRDLQNMTTTRSSSDSDVTTSQGTQISSDEAERKKVADNIEKMYQKTKSAVETELSSLETDVNTVFDTGVDKAIKDMKDYVEKRFDDRYSGVIGKGKWVKDKLLPLPGFVKAWFDEAHKQFRKDLDDLVVRVAGMVESRLKKAKDRIDEGQREIENYVSTLEGDLKKFGENTAAEVNQRFDQLRQSVDDKRKELASSLAQRYKDAVDKGAKALQDLKDKHKSLVERIRDAIVAVVKVLREFKERIMSLLKKGAATIRQIVKDPIGFLKNILNAIKQGLNQFVKNIWTHLKNGFMGWLFGALGDAGLQMPAEFNIAGILSIVLQVLGLTYDRIRAKAVRIIGERNVMIIEKVVEIVKTLFTQGPGALWEQLKEYLGNLKEIIVNAIQEWVITKIITAAVTKLVSMFNPVGAIIQAIMTIYNVVMFLIERINQIMAFVKSVIDSVSSIVQGNIGAAANFIEQALARTLPVIISFLARLIGLGGISQKIKNIIMKIQKRVDDAIDKFIRKLMTKARGLFSSRRGGNANKEQDKMPDDKQKAVADGLRDLEKIQDQHEEGNKIDRASAEDVAQQVKKRHSVFKSITVKDGGATWNYEYSVNPKGTHTGAKKTALTTKKIQELLKEARALSAADVSEAMVKLQKLEPGILTRYCGAADGYEKYLNEKKNQGGSYQDPKAYLKGRAARKLGKTGEDFWIRKVYNSGKNNDPFDVMNDSSGEWETVIPDILTPTVVGDAKNWASLSYTHQLQMFNRIAKAKTMYPGRVKYKTGNVVNTDRRLVVLVRHESHSAGETTVSGPLKTAALVRYVITDKDVKPENMST